MATTTAMRNQTEVGFRILTEAEEAERLDPENPKCAFYGYVGNRPAVEEGLDLVAAGFKHRTKTDDGREVCCRRIPKGIALLGGASAGKTEFVRRLAKATSLPYCETDAKQVTDTAVLFDLLGNTYKANGVPLVMEDEFGDEELYILPAGILFIDEIHMANGKVQDSFLKMTEPKDRTLLLPGKRVDCRNLCIVIATTDRGKLRPAFKTRFRQITLKRHTRAEVAEIVRLANPDWDRGACWEVAKIKPLARTALDFADSVKLAAARLRMDHHQAIKVVAEREGIEEYGLTRTALRVLELLADNPEGLSRKSLCGSVGIEEDEFENDVMPFLGDTEDHKAFMVVNNRHKITDAGLNFLTARAKR